MTTVSKTSEIKEIYSNMESGNDEKLSESTNTGSSDDEDGSQALFDWQDGEFEPPELTFTTTTAGICANITLEYWNKNELDFFDLFLVLILLRPLSVKQMHIICRLSKPRK